MGSAPLGDRESKTGVPFGITAHQNDEARTGIPIGRSENALKVRRALQSVLGREALVGFGGTPFVPVELVRQIQGIKRTRPLARRALRTLRPLRVADRARKPWTRARLSRLG